MISIERLDWDSDFFEIEIGRITYKESEEFNLETIKSLMHETKFNLVYVFEDVKIFSRIFNPTTYLVDTKVVFQKEITRLAEDIPEVTIYDRVHQPSLNNIYDLALASGEYSRFKTDAKFKYSDFVRLYKAWVDNSLSGTFADEIFVFVDTDIIFGFVSVKYKNEQAVIGLIAVDNSHRGKSIGTKLIKKVESAAYMRGCKSISVATQLENEKACSFYEKNEFKINEMTNIYHIWK